MIESASAQTGTDARSEPNGWSRSRWSVPLVLTAFYLVTRPILLDRVPRPFCDEGFWTWAIVFWQKTGRWVVLPEMPHVLLSPMNTALWVIWAQLFPIELTSARSLMVLLGLGSMLFFLEAAGRAYGRKFGALATLPFVFGSYYFGFARSVLLEPLVIFWLALAWLFWTRPGRRAAIGAGVAMGLAIAAKISGVILLLAIITSILQPGITSGERRTRLQRVAWAAGAAVVVAGVFYAATMVLAGPEFLRSWRGYGAINTTGTSWRVLAGSLAGFVAQQPLVCLLAAVGVATYLGRAAGTERMADAKTIPPSSRDFFLPAAWLCWGIVFALMTRALGSWRLFVFFPALCVFFAHGLEAIAALAERLFHSRRSFVRAGVFVWCLAEAMVFVGYHALAVRDREALFRLAHAAETRTDPGRAILSHPLLTLVVDRPLVPRLGAERILTDLGPDVYDTTFDIDTIVFFVDFPGIKTWRDDWLAGAVTGPWTRSRFELVERLNGGEIWTRIKPTTDPP